MNNTIKKVVEFLNFSLKVDANSTSTGAAYQPNNFHIPVDISAYISSNEDIKSQIRHNKNKT